MHAKLFLVTFLNCLVLGISTDNATRKHDGAYVYAWCDVQPNNATEFSSTHNVSGKINIKQWSDGGLVEISVDLVGFDPGLSGYLYEFHIHELDDLSEGCQSTGGYFNPFDDWTTHIGDWGSVPCDNFGTIRTQFKDIETSLLGFYSVLGRSIVVHQRTAPEISDSENSWLYDDHNRLACCVIQSS